MKKTEPTKDNETFVIRYSLTLSLILKASEPVTCFACGTPSLWSGVFAKPCTQ